VSASFPIFLGVAMLQPVAQAPTAYWQQSLSYRIDASLDEPAGVLRGTERIVYRNHSPDSLTTFSLHLYLNAFRPGSRWSAADSAEHRRRFNDLKDPDFGFNHVSNVRLDGRPVVPSYPFAPDSTIVRFRLPVPLAPGDSVLAELEWDARPSTVPRRQGRRGRAFDFAQWYPRVVAYDRHGWQEHPLYPAGEFYGDFGDFTVTLDVPADQVVGATGVPLCGDPGWEAANRDRSRSVEYGRDRYPAALAGLAPNACAARAAGRKTIVWRAEDVHHFAISMRPDYRYEGGRFGDVAVHVLYQPGDEASWGKGVVVKRTETALDWLHGLFGPFPWPQITNVHRIEGGGTEFPMMIHDGGPEQGLILHELGHNYLMGVFANNEWREGWLDEGFTSFQTTWFGEEHGVRGAYEATERQIALLDLDGWSEPTSLASEDYRDFLTYNMMIYARGELFFHQLREIVGADTMRRILRTYYDRWRLRHVDEAAFRAVAEEVSHRDLSTFFGQWLHSTDLYDYAVGRITARKRPRAGGAGGNEWITRVEVRRKAPGRFPVEVVVRSKHDSAWTRVSGDAEREWVELVTTDRPREVVVDPRARAHDWNMLNNRRKRLLFGWGSPSGRTDLHFDRVFSTRVDRSATSFAFLPTVWYNDAGGVMAGVRVRSNYLGRFDEMLLEANLATKECCADSSRAAHFYARFRNPRWLYAPRLTTELEAFRMEGRAGAGLAFERQRLGHQTYGPTTFVGGSLRWVSTYDLGFLDPAQYDDAGTIEAELHVRSSERRGSWLVGARLSAVGGVEYRNQGSGFDTEDRYDAQPYVRLVGEATARRALGRRSELGLRLFGGWVHGSRDPVHQRWFALAGADPYERLRNPFIRSTGAIFTEDLHFHEPGGANIRGLATDVLVTTLGAANLELDRSIARPGSALVRDIRIAGFTDWAVTNGFFTRKGQNDVAGDAGVGLRITHTIGTTTFVTRFDFPVYVTHADRSIGSTDNRFGFRWVFGVR
jgi:hypothetical protein